MFASVSIWGIVLGAAAAMVIGVLWYSPYLFGKSWMKNMGISEKEMNSSRASVMPHLIVSSLLTAYGLSLVTVYLQRYTGGSWVKSGFEASLVAFFGFAGTALVVHDIFDPRARKNLPVNMGNRLVTLVAMGLIVGSFLK